MERSDVIVTGFRLNAAAPPAKVLQTILGINEADAKALSKRFPCVVLADVEWAEAERVSLALRGAGGYTKLRTTGGKSEAPGPEDTPKTLPPAELEVAHAAPHAAPRSRPAAAPFAAAQTVLEVPPLRMTPAAQAAFDLGHAPTLFSDATPAPVAAKPAPVAAKPAPMMAEPRASLPYALGELEIVPSKSTPAPALPGAAAPPRPVQAAPSQPAPAATAIKSQPAPAPTKQPAPAPSKLETDTHGARMLDDGFGGETAGPALELELDYGNVKTTGKVEYKQRGKINVREKEKPRGFWATLLLPIVLLQAAVPHALALTGVAAASGAAVYLARSSSEKRAGSGDETALDADGKQRPHKKGGLMGLLDEITGSGEDKALGAQEELSAEGKTDTGSATEATHPLVKLAPKAMEPAIASILRQRIRGLHKVMIEWPEGAKPEASTECVLLEQEHAGNLKVLLSTGRAVTPPAAVRDQLWDHIGTLRAANGDATAAYIPICLAN